MNINPDLADKNKPLVSLVIPTYMREELFVQTLQCAFGQDYPNLEIIVVDQTPKHTQDTLDFLERNKNKFTLIRTDTPSVTKARNIGTRIAHGEFVVFVDDDTSFEPDFIKYHVEALSGDCEFVQGRVIEEGCRVYDSPVWLNKWGNFSGSDFCDKDGITNNITGCNFSFKKSLFEQLNGFDEAFQGIAVCEDTDFAYRAFKHGFKGCFSSKAKLNHHRANTGGVGHGIENQFFDVGFYRNKLYFYRKNFPYIVYLYQKIKFFSKGLRRFIRLYRLASKQAKKIRN